MSLWTVSKYRKGKTPLELGDVEAINGPDALLQAFKLWPEKLDNSLPQAGLSARRKQEAAQSAE